MYCLMHFTHSVAQYLLSDIQGKQKVNGGYQSHQLQDQ